RRSLGGVRQTGALGLSLLGHREDVVSRELPDEIGVVPAHVRLDLRDEVVVALGPDHLSALAIDQLAHASSSVVWRTLSATRVASTLQEPWRRACSSAAGWPLRWTTVGSRRTSPDGRASSFSCIWPATGFARSRATS